MGTRRIDQVSTQWKLKVQNHTCSTPRTTGSQKEEDGVVEDAGLDNNLFTTISRELNKTTSTHAETKLATSMTLSSLSTVQRAIYRAEVKEAVLVVGSPSKLK